MNTTAPIVDDGDAPSSLKTSNAVTRCPRCSGRTEGSAFRNMPGWVRVQVWRGKWRWVACECNQEGR